MKQANERSYKLTLYTRLGSKFKNPSAAQRKKAAQGMARALNQFLSDHGHPETFRYDSAELEEVTE